MFFINVFIYVICPDYIALNDRMIIGEYEIGKDVDGRRCGLISGIVLAFI
jgi:hypothetical protein